MCKRFHLEATEKWYGHQTRKIIESESVKIPWYFQIQTDKKMQHSKLDIVLFDKENKEYWLTDIACPLDFKIKE